MTDHQAEELDALIVQNLHNVDTAAHRLLHFIQPLVAKSLNEIAEKWAKKNKWTGDFDWWESELRLAPAAWGTGDQNVASFYLAGGPDDDLEYNLEEDVFWLTRFCRKGRGSLGIRWYNGDGLDCTHAKWKKFVQTQSKIVEAISKSGFTPEDTGWFYLDVPIDATTLSQSIREGSVEDALAPFKGALDRLLGARPQFDLLIKAAKAEFPTSPHV
jgi:hypothetical protein